MCVSKRSMMSPRAVNCAARSMRLVTSSGLISTRAAVAWALIMMTWVLVP